MLGAVKKHFEDGQSLGSNTELVLAKFGDNVVQPFLRAFHGLTVR
jgi:hypothetical protein